MTVSSRAVGMSGLTLPKLVFGGNVFGWTADEATSFYLLDACMDTGLTTIDTADVYTRLGGGEGGESETIIGRWLKARGPAMRERVTLISKCGLPMGEGLLGLSKAYIPKAFEASLKRLNTDYIDIYMAHWDDPETPLPETLDAFGQLRDAGKIKATGGSNYTPARLREVIATARENGLHGFDIFEGLYNLYDRAPFEDEIEGICTEAGVASLSYFSLASGFLTGKYRAGLPGEENKRAMFLQSYFNPRGERILAALDEISAELNATPAQVSIAWLLTRPQLTGVIASASKARQFDDLLAALTLDLPDAGLAQLDAASREEE